MSAREGSACLAGLMQKAKELQARAFQQQPPLPAVAVERKVTSVGVQTSTVVRPQATFLTGLEAQEFTERLLVGESEDIESVDLVAYSFDVKKITDAISALGPKVRVLMDRSMSVGGRTKLQLQAAQQLNSNGCSVRVGQGRGIRAAYLARDRDVGVGDTLRGIVHVGPL